jgi:hypothetical protein
LVRCLYFDYSGSHCVGGYHEARDLVLIMDVARFKYPPHWVPLSLLYTAMLDVDQDSGTSRGWMTLCVAQYKTCALTCCSLNSVRGKPSMSVAFRKLLAKFNDTSMYFVS